MGILINTGFDVGSSNPIDSRTLKETTLERDALISDGLVYENLKVYCKDTQTEYRWTGTEWEISSSSSSSGTDISMTDYYTKTEVDNDFLKKTDAASIYATKTELNEKANDDEVAKKADITDLQEQTSDLQEQIDNLDIPDLTGINTKLTELENNQIKKLSIQHQNPNEVYVKITACNSNDFSKILFTDSYGGSILITGGMVTGADYKTIKVVRLTNGDWSSYNPSTNTLNKIQNVYLGGTDIYIKCGAYTNLYIEGGFISAERVYSIPSDVTQLPILDLTQAASKRVYNSLEELNTAKGLSISFTAGEDNTMKIVDALSPIETFADYFANGINYNRFGIDTNTYGTDISLLIITKFNDNLTIIRAYMSNGKLLVRRYQNGVLRDWSYDKTDLSEVNTKLSQLENKANFIPVVADNPTDYDLNNYKENGNYGIGDSSKYSNTPISRPGLLTVIRSNSYRLQIYTVVNNDDVYFRKSTDWGKTWSSWVLLNGSSGASDNGTNNDVYTTEEQAVGTWINGKTLYRRTIEDNTLRETGTDMIKLFAYNTNMKIVKFEGVVTLANNNGQTFIRSLPYSKDSEEVYITKTTLDTLRLDSYLTNYKLGGYIVSVYYYKV